MCHEQWALTVIKLLRFFLLIFAVFLPDFIFLLYHNGTVIQVSWKLWMFLISTPHKTKTFTVRLAVTTKYQGNGFAAEVLLGRDYPRVVPIGPIVTGVIVYKKKLYIAFSILEHDGMRPPKLRPSRSICRRVMAFRILSNIDRLPTFNIWSHDCQCCPNLLLHTKFHHNWFTRSTSRRP